MEKQKSAPERTHKTCAFTGHSPKGLGYPESDGRCGKKMVLQRQYTPDCLQKRNKYMVDHADIVLTVWIIRPDTLEVQ